MSGRVSRRAVVAALIRREFIVYSRDKLYLFLTGLTLVFVVGVFWITPGEVDDSLTVAVSPPLERLIAEGMVVFDENGVLEATPHMLPAHGRAPQDGVRFLELENRAKLQAVLRGEIEAWLSETGGVVLRQAEGLDDPPEGAERVHPTMGIAFPEEFAADLVSGRAGDAVMIYAHASVPLEIRGALRSFVHEIAYQLTGQAVPVTMLAEEVAVLGPDRAGDQIALREKLIPMIALMILLVETLSLSSLIAREVLQRTVTAVLVSPACVSDFLLSKTIFGASLGTAQTVLVLALVGAFTATNWPLLLVSMLVGALMFTGVAMIVGAAGKEFTGQLFYAMLSTVPLAIPAFAVLFPGSVAAWVRVLPTYFVLDALLGATVYRAGWAELWPSLGISVGWVVALYGLGLFILRRKVVSL